MSGKKVRRGNAGGAATLARQVYEGLRDEITTGKLKPGAVLSRRKIAASYGTSYASVIEAIVRLEHTGLIEAESAQMARVRKVTRELIEQIYVLREAYEVQTIHLACQSATPAEVEELQGLARTVDEHITAWDNARGEIEDPDGPLLHWQFHRRIAELSRSPALVQELERIEVMRRLQANWFHVPGLEDPPGWHAQLVDAIRARDALAAVATMRAHVQRGLERELQGYRMRAATREY
jgi:DNA-binding GntR family transcriptional regulator